MTAKFRDLFFSLGCAASALGLAACSSAPPATFDLTPALAPGAANLRAPLAISEPVASLDLDSQRILVRTSPDTVANLAGAQWSDRLPSLVQSRLLQSFQNAKQTRFIGRSGASFSAENELQLDIRAFELDVTKGQAKIDIAAKIVNTRSGRVLAAQIFTAQAPAGGTGGADAAAALNVALDSVIRQIMKFASARG
jgi:cholesterol transport system auxiliary component